MQSRCRFPIGRNQFQNTPNLHRRHRPAPRIGCLRLRQNRPRRNSEWFDRGGVDLELVVRAALQRGAQCGQRRQLDLAGLLGEQRRHRRRRHLHPGILGLQSPQLGSVHTSHSSTNRHSWFSRPPKRTRAHGRPTIGQPHPRRPRRRRSRRPNRRAHPRARETTALLGVGQRRRHVRGQPGQIGEPAQHAHTGTRHHAMAERRHSDPTNRCAIPHLESDLPLGMMDLEQSHHPLQDRHFR